MIVLMEEQVCPLNVGAKAKVETGCKTFKRPTHGVGQCRSLKVK